MISKVNDIQELNKIVRTQLIAQSGLDGNQVLNGVSIHGQDLLKMINQYAYKSYDLKDSVLVFVLEPRTSSNNMSETTADDKLRIISSYQFHCYLYGYSSPTLANQIIARMRTEYVRLLLQQEGVYLESISEAEMGNDFINETLMVRTDFFINISCESRIEQASIPNDFAKINMTIEEI